MLEQPALSPSSGGDALRWLQEVIWLQAQASEYQVAAILGERRFAQLKQALAILVAQINADDSADEAHR